MFTSVCVCGCLSIGTNVRKHAKHVLDTYNVDEENECQDVCNLR